MHDLIVQEIDRHPATLKYKYVCISYGIFLKIRFRYILFERNFIKLFSTNCVKGEVKKMIWWYRTNRTTKLLQIEHYTFCHVVWPEKRILLPVVRAKSSGWLSPFYCENKKKCILKLNITFSLFFSETTTRRRDGQFSTIPFGKPWSELSRKIVWIKSTKRISSFGWSRQGCNCIIR